MGSPRSRAARAASCRFPTVRLWPTNSDGLTGRNTTDEEDDGLPYRRDQFTDFTAQGGGPIVRDKFWFFAGYQYQKDSLSQPGADPNFPSPTTNKRINAKVQYQINASNGISTVMGSMTTPPASVRASTLWLPECSRSACG